MRWIGLSTLFLTAIFGLLLVVIVRDAARPSTGIYVWVLEPIPPEQRNLNYDYSDRQIVLQVFEHECKLNLDTMDRNTLLDDLTQIYKARAEKVLLVHGDPAISHQRMMEVLSDIQARIPDLHLVLLPPNRDLLHWRVRIPQVVIGSGVRVQGTHSESWRDTSPRPPWAEGGSIRVQ